MGEGGAGSGPGSSPALHQLGGPGMPDGSVGGGMPPGFFPVRLFCPQVQSF